jgi:hypothetical protein
MLPSLHKKRCDELKPSLALIGTPPLNSKTREAYEELLALAARHPNAHSFQAFCIYITWQQVTEETIAHHFKPG